jgi:hypothetical protein
MQDDTPPPSAQVTASIPKGSSRWNPILPFVISVIGSLTFIFASGTTFSSALTTFALCFTVAYITQIIFGRFFLALPFFDTVSTTADQSKLSGSAPGNPKKQ